MLPVHKWFSINEQEKDADYANQVIRWVRTQMRPLVNSGDALLGMQYLLGQQDMTPIESLFQNPAMLNLDNKPVSRGLGITDAHGQPVGSRKSTDMQVEMGAVRFKSLPVLEKIRNIITAEMKKMGSIVTAKCSDPTSTVAREDDEYLIKNRKKIENIFTYLYSSIGQKEPVNFSEYQTRFNEKPDSGNTLDFEKMGLNPEDPEDVSFFMSLFHKLDWEIEMQKVMDAVMSFNQVDDRIIEMLVNDALAKKAVCMQQYVSDESGAICYDYLTPETVYIYGASGRRKDMNDAYAKAYQQPITIKEFLQRVGNSFDFEEHLNDLILSVFTASNGTVDITGINPDYRTATSSWYCRGKDGMEYTYSQFMQFKVLFGYMEWTSQNETEYGEQLSSSKKSAKIDNAKNQKKAKSKNAKYKGDGIAVNNEKAGGKYPAKSRYETPTYKAYYLCLTLWEHIMFDYGKVTYHDIKGYNDINQNFTIITYKEPGDPIAMMAIPMIDIINEAFYKWRYEIRRAKPRGTDYNIDSLAAVSDIIFDDTTSRESKLLKTMQWMDGSANRFWTFPKVDGKPVMMTNNQLNIDNPNGLSPEIMRYWEIMVVTWDKLIDMVMGSADLRQGESTGSRSSMNNEFKALEYSQNSTYYIPDMITFMCRQLAERTGMVVEDIIQFKNYDALAYKFLEDLVGNEALDKIGGMGKTAIHRFGIFVESLNLAPQKAKLSVRIDFALQNKLISNAQALLIEQIKSPTLAFRTMAYFEQRNERLAQQRAMQQQQQAHENLMQIEQVKASVEKMKVDANIIIAEMETQGGIKEHIITQQGGLAKAEMKNQADSRQIYEAVHADFLMQQRNLENTGKVTGSSINPAVQPPQNPISQEPLPQPRRESVLQQNMDLAEPGPTTAAEET